MWKAPSFWDHAPPWWAKSFAWLYGSLAWAYHHYPRYPAYAPCPVFSLGSLLMGGSGKTPMTLMLGHFLQEKGFKPIIFTRGYGGKYKNPMQVNPAQHKPYEVGEEALLLAEEFPTYVARQRKDALNIVNFSERTVILLDDGHQHHSLFKNGSFLVINSYQQLGNEHLFPAGPLRESLRIGSARADGILYISSEGGLPRLEGIDLPIFPVKSQFSCSIPQNVPIIGFAGIGCPQRFQALLGEMFDTVVDFIVFPNHILYGSHHEARLWQASQKAQLITTSKDWIKLSPSLQSKVAVIHQNLTLQTPHELYYHLVAKGLS